MNKHKNEWFFLYKEIDLVGEDTSFCLANLLYHFPSLDASSPSVSLGIPSTHEHDLFLPNNLMIYVSIESITENHTTRHTVPMQ